jgi:hypothetical protein
VRKVRKGEEGEDREKGIEVERDQKVCKEKSKQIPKHHNLQQKNQNKY